MRNIIAAVCVVLPLAAVPAMAADANRGKTLYQKCVSCHSDTAATADVGPNLKGVYGRKAAALDNFRYSNALRRSELVWDDSNLKEYILNPQGKVKGNRMPFSGFTDPAEVDDVVAYLKTLK
jgi:cytochrome c